MGVINSVTGALESLGQKAVGAITGQPTSEEELQNLRDIRVPVEAEEAKAQHLTVPQYAASHPEIQHPTPPPSAPAPQDPAETVLRSVKGIKEDSLADAWDAYNNSQDTDTLSSRLQNVQIPEESKARLWDAKQAEIDAKRAETIKKGQQHPWQDTAYREPVPQDESWFHANISAPVQEAARRIRDTLVTNESEGMPFRDIYEAATGPAVPKEATDQEAQDWLKRTGYKSVDQHGNRNPEFEIEHAKNEINGFRGKMWIQAKRANDYANGLSDPDGEARAIAPEKLMSPEFKKENPVPTAIVHFLGTLTTEENAVILAATGVFGMAVGAAAAAPALGTMATVVVAAPRFVSAYFSGQMAVGLAQQMPGLVQAKKDRDAALAAGDNDKAKDIEWQMYHDATTTALTAYMAYASAYHAATGNPEPILPAVKEAAGETAQYAAEKGVEAMRNVPAVAGMAAGVGMEGVKKIGGILGRSNDVGDSVLRAGKYTAKQADKMKESMKVAKDDVQAVLNANPDIDSPGEAAAALRKSNSDEEQKMMQTSGLTRDTKEAVIPNAQKILEDRIDKFFADNKGRFSREDAAKAKKDIMDHFLQRETVGVDESGKPVYEYRAPNLFEAENMRQGLNDLVRPQYNANSQPTTNAFKAAAADAVVAVRDMIDQSYHSNGVEDVKEFRVKEAAKINIAEALEAGQKIADQQGEPGLWKSLMKKYGAPSTIMAIALGTHSPITLTALAPYLLGEYTYNNYTNKILNIRRAMELAAKNPNARATGVNVRPEEGPTQPGGPLPVPPQTPVPAPVVDAISMQAAGEGVTEYTARVNGKEVKFIAPSRLTREQIEQRAIATPVRPIVDRDILKKLSAYNQVLPGALQYVEMVNNLHADIAMAHENPEAFKKQSPWGEDALKKLSEVSAAVGEAITEKLNTEKEQRQVDIEKAQKESVQMQKEAEAAQKEATETREEEDKEKLKAQKESSKNRVAAEEKRNKIVEKVKSGELKPTEGTKKPLTAEVQPLKTGAGPNGETPEKVVEHEIFHTIQAEIDGIHGAHMMSDQESGKENQYAAIIYQGDQHPIAKEIVEGRESALNHTPQEIADDARMWMRAHLAGGVGQEMFHGISREENVALDSDVDQAREVFSAAKKVGAPLGTEEEEFADAANQVESNFTKFGIHEMAIAESHAREEGLPADHLMSPDRLRVIRRAINERIEAAKAAAVQNGLEGTAAVAGKPESNKNVEGVAEGEKDQPRAGTEERPAAGTEEHPTAEGSELARNRGGVNHEDVLEAIKNKHGVTDDTAGIREGGQSFITPEGQFVHLPASTTHTDAITESGGPAPGPENGHDNRPAFINDTGAIRVHLANERAGKTLAASVPAEGVKNAEQVGAIQRLVGQELPRTGNLRLERADVNAENKNEATAEKAFPRVSDVPKMLKKIGALPSNVEKSLMTYDAMKGLKEANEDQEQKGRVNAAPPTPVPELDRAAIQGGQHSAPASTYHEAAQNEGNPWVRRSADPEKSDAPTNEGRQLMIQFSSDLINGTKGEADQATQYYDKLYSGARPGYARMQDFWEIPQWHGFVSHVLPDADVYVVRDMNQAKDFLKTAKYDRVLASALDVNTSFLKDLAKNVPEQKFDVGGYVEPGTFLEHPNVKYHASVEAMTKDPYYAEKGIQYKNGTDYRHYEGSDVIPRLTMSDGCLHKCAFCVVPKKLEVTPNAVVDQQAQSMGKLGAKLVYLNDKTFGQAPNYQHLSDVYTKMKEANPDFQGFVVQTTAAQMGKMPADWLQKSGIKYVELGVESYNDPILKEMHKPANEKLIDAATDKLRENNIALIPNILIGLPGENANTYAHTLEFLKRNKDIISHANIYNLAVYKDAELGKKLTTANDGDFNENVLEKSFHADPEVHRVFAGDLYGVGQELLNGTPKPLESPERSQLSVRNGAKNIDDMDENDLMFQTSKARNAIFQRAEESAKGGGFTIHPDTGHVPNEGHVIEVHPESRENLPNDITAADVSKFHDKVRPILDENPELHLGGYGKQLNLSAVGHPEGARKVGNDLDQQTAWDARNQTSVPLEGQGIKTQFPDYPLDQRLKDMGARKPDGTPTGLGTPERSQLGYGLVRRTTGDEAKDKIIEDAGGVPGGVQRGIPGKLPDQAYIHDPVTGTSLNLPLDEITPEAVANHMLESRKAYARTPEGQAKYGLNADGTPTAERSELAAKAEPDKKERRAGFGGVDLSAPKNSGFAGLALDKSRKSTWGAAAGMSDMGRGGKAWLSPDGKFTPVDKAHYEHTGGTEIEDHLAAGNIRLGGLDVADSPVLVHAYKSVPTPEQRAAIGKAVADQGSAIYDLSYNGKRESGEAKSASELEQTMRGLYGAALGEEKPDYSKTHPYLPDSVIADMSKEHLAMTANEPRFQQSVFKSLNRIKPTIEEIANVAKAGHVLGGWWQRFIDAFKALGEPDEAAEIEHLGPSHTEALKAFHGSVSGNKAVESANKIGWGTYKDWLDQNKPRTRAEINQIVVDNGGMSDKVNRGKKDFAVKNKAGEVTRMVPPGEIIKIGIDTDKLWKLVNSPQMRDVNPEPFTGNAFLDSPVPGKTEGAIKIPSMVATTAGEGHLDNVVFDTHMRDIYQKNGLSDADYIADSIHMRRAARELGLKPGEGQEQVWGSVLGLKQLLGQGMTPEEAAQGLDDPTIHGIGKDYAAVILEAIETDPEFRQILDGLHKYGFSPTSEKALGKLREIVKSGEARIGTGPQVNRELLGKTAEGLARHMGIDVDAIRREREEAPTFNFGYNAVQDATNKGALDRLSKP